MTQDPLQAPYPVSNQPVQSSTNTKAILSLIAGIIGLLLGMITFCFSGVCSLAFTIPAAIAGLVLGYMAKSEIATSGDASLAIVGIVLGWVNAAVSLLMIVLVAMIGVGMAGILLLGALSN